MTLSQFTCIVKRSLMVTKKTQHKYTICHSMASPGWRTKLQEDNVWVMWVFLFTEVGILKWTSLNMLMCVIWGSPSQSGPLIPVAPTQGTPKDPSHLAIQEPPYLNLSRRLAFDRIAFLYIKFKVCIVRVILRILYNMFSLLRWLFVSEKSFWTLLSSFWKYPIHLSKIY